MCRCGRGEDVDIQELLQKQNVRINIIGDSIAAGAGSTGGYKTEQLIFEDTKQFFRRVAPNSWWGLLGAYLKKKNSTVTVINNGCGGVYSYQIKNHLEEMISEEDDIVFILMGLNDRKRKDGMTELKENSEKIDDIIFNPNGLGDGLHPGDFVQKLMFGKIVEELGI